MRSMTVGYEKGLDMRKNRPLYVDIHVLQTLPPSNINRDDTGSPKTARFGGVTRARVSSQAWKKAVRESFSSMLNEEELGVRTKRVDMICERLLKDYPDVEEQTAKEAVRYVLNEALKKNNKLPVDEDDETGALLTEYLLLIGNRQAKELAKLAKEYVDKAVPEKKVKERAKEILKSGNSVDLALFGRMIADAPDLNVDAAVQVAHAIGVGRVEPEFDYFTAMDDRAPDENPGAGMIGTVEFNSSTLYRYATVDVAHLEENLGSAEDAAHALEAFLKAFVTSMPTGHQNSFAHRTLPDAVVIQLRDTQPVSLVTAFERPVEAIADKSQAAVACEKLVERERLIDSSFGVTPLETFVVCAAPGVEVLADLSGGETVSLEGAVESVGERAMSYYAELGIGDAADEV